MCHVKNGPFETRPPVRESTLSSTCTLGVILAAQRLDLNTVDKIHYYSKLVDSNRHNGLSVEEHMHSQYKNMADLNGNELTCSPIENLVKAANAVRNFLISKSFCDCSLIISFQRIVKTNPAIDKYVKLRLENSQKLANCDVIQDESGNLYLVSLAVVDTDPK
uniref:Inositol-pentakisphosphate 2-kinase n=1 Tax=Ciona savignyi TaxID=51511 RepID=H2Y4Z5_CIOSA